MTPSGHDEAQQHVDARVVRTRNDVLRAALDLPLYQIGAPGSVKQ